MFYSSATFFRSVPINTESNVNDIVNVMIVIVFHSLVGNVLLSSVFFFFIFSRLQSYIVEKSIIGVTPIIPVPFSTPQQECGFGMHSDSYQSYI
jgi:hypothetical protein